MIKKKIAPRLDVIIECVPHAMTRNTAAVLYWAYYTNYFTL